MRLRNVRFVLCARAVSGPLQHRAAGGVNRKLIRVRRVPWIPIPDDPELRQAAVQTGLIMTAADRP